MPQQPPFLPETLSAPQHPPDRQTEFIYPYNFVPHGGPRRRDGQPQGMGTDQPFKPLHRFDGLTGRIEYTLNALSRLFVADSEGTTVYERQAGDDERPENKEKHRHRVMDFFNVQGRLCLPGTSIKGVVRSVAEAASNSTMGIGESHETRFTYRKAGGFRRQCGKWTSRGTIQPWGMAKLPLSSLCNALASVLGRTPTDADLFSLQHNPVQVRLWKLHTGIPVVVEFELNGTWYQGATVPNPSTIPLSTGTFGDRPRKKRMITSNGTQYNCPWDREVSQCFQGTRGGPLTAGSSVQFKAATFPELNFGGPYTFGNNRVFEIQYGGRTWSAVHPYSYRGELLFHKNYLDPGVQRSDRYARVLYDISASDLPVSQQALDAYHAAYGALPALNSIIYYETDQGGHQVIEFGPVAVFKSADPSAPQRLFQRVLQFAYPPSFNRLCPATRLFGWTPESEDEGGVAGRVCFSMAWSDRRLEDAHLIPIQALGSPKPNYYPFYLRPEDGHQPSTQAAYYAEHPEHPWAQVQGTPRGRKFYLHHPRAIGAGPALVDSAELTAGKVSHETRQNDPNWQQSHQNATCAVLPGGATFRGVIEFDSLDPYELGLLLWALTFSDSPLQESQQNAHKLGMGKSLGLGSVRFHLERVVIQEPEKSWLDLEHPETDDDLESAHERILEADELARLVRRFKTWMVTDKDEDDPQQAGQYDASTFVQDLLAVTRLDLVPNDVPIQYYPPYWREDRFRRIREWFADEGFTYFVHQRQKRVRNEEEPLRTPRAIQRGHRQGTSWPS